MSLGLRADTAPPPSDAPALEGRGRTTGVTTESTGRWIILRVKAEAEALNW